MTNRRNVLRALFSGAAGPLTGCSRSLALPSTSPSTETPTSRPRTAETARESTSGRAKTRIRLETAAEGLEMPVAVGFPPGNPGRLYVAERSGTIHVYGPDGRRSEPLLDLQNDVVISLERGLLGLALHPEFERNRRLFVRYSAPSRDGTPDEYSHTFVLAEFRVGPDGRRADTASERSILEIPQPYRNHNAGDLSFGPDGLLYVPIGDGGNAGDRGIGHAEDWYDRVPGGNGQDVSENLLGSILRIDVDERDGERLYGVPADNPLVGEAGLDEQYAWGFRNPWRVSFDRDRLFVGDVGQRRYEEVNVVEKGGNYGWNVEEGTHCFGVEEFGVEDCPDAVPEDVRGGEPLLDPVVTYPNWKYERAPVSGAAVICGYRYRGSAAPILQGRFVFADWVARGRLFAATPAEAGLWSTEVVEVISEDRDKLYTVNAFGRDPSGEVYVLSTGNDGIGGVYRLAADGRTTRNLTGGFTRPPRR